MCTMLAKLFHKTMKETPIEAIPEKIPVFMPDEEVKQFLIFQQYFKPITVLINAHVFEQKDATILLDFDHSGTLVKVRRNDALWKIN